ncbi:MAG: sterol desaturase family protein [Myxococcota bacterium]
MSDQELLIWAIPWFFATMIIERLLYGRPKLKGMGRGHTLVDTACSLAMGIGHLVVAGVCQVAAFAVLVWGYRFRLFDIPDAWWVWPLLILAEDHCYYWFHRGHHEVRLLWAAHVNHHSSRFYNLSTALRQSWTTPITGPLFWLPLALLGFRPDMIVIAKVISLLYQYWIHTELIKSLGPLEWVLNTPSHHRVHHARNPQYLDKNYGGIFIIFDRLYGTFEPEREPVDYGLTHQLETHHPVKVAFHEWIAMARDVWRAPWRDKLDMVFRSPAYLAARHDESGSPSRRPPPGPSPRLDAAMPMPLHEE